MIKGLKELHISATENAEMMAKQQEKNKTEIEKNKTIKYI